MKRFIAVELIVGWLNDIKRYSGSDVPVLLVGNKSDLNDMR